ncbi:MAG: hypothetical protein QOE11_3222 [Solirubrobacteraceae bacterium]|jgi:hypothetical protein|nr:hypothetical protein [Solirubrobacteraceae bacterium]
MPFWLQAALEVGGFWVAVAVVWRCKDGIRLAAVWAVAVVLLAVALVLQAEGVRAAGVAALGLVASMVVVSFALLLAGLPEGGAGASPDAQPSAPRRVLVAALWSALGATGLTHLALRELFDVPAVWRAIAWLILLVVFLASFLQQSGAGGAARK